MSAVTTHVLDAATGMPAVGVPVVLYALSADRRTATELAAGATDADGRIGELGPDRLPAGDHRLVFDIAAYDALTGRTGFFPEISLTFTITDPDRHYHVPVLLSPFAYSTYRGS